MNGLNDQIRQKIMKQKIVGHESAAIVTYKELEEWANKADELVKKCSIPAVVRRSEQLVCSCELPTSDFELDDGTICCCACEKELAK